jgi:hypothetical protein
LILVYWEYNIFKGRWGLCYLCIGGSGGIEIFDFIDIRFSLSKVVLEGEQGL